jgi:hypothetical protein
MTGKVNSDMTSVLQQWLGTVNLRVFGNRAVRLTEPLPFFRELANVIHNAANFGVIIVNVAAFCLFPDSVNADFDFSAVIHEKERLVFAVNKADAFFGSVLHNKNLL